MYVKEKKMVLRNRARPRPLEKLDAIISRIPEEHSALKNMKSHAAKYQKGYNGERKLDYFIRGMPGNFSILNDVTLTIFNKKVQIDSILITQYAIYIIEVKSYEGIVTFDTGLGQFIQENKEKLEGYKYPITQVEQIQFYLMRWLQERGLSGLPIYYFIVFSEASTLIKVKGDEHSIRRIVSHVDKIQLRLINFDEYLKKNRSGNQSLKNKIINALLNECEDFDYDVLQKFGINRNELLPGVHCPKCSTLGMKRFNRKWYCQKCNTSSDNAHKKALYHYTLLIHHEMKNEDCRKFLQLDSRFVARKMLQDSHLTLKSGNKIWSTTSKSTNRDFHRMMEHEM